MIFNHSGTEARMVSDNTREGEIEGAEDNG